MVCAVLLFSASERFQVLFPRVEKGRIVYKAYFVDLDIYFMINQHASLCSFDVSGLDFSSCISTRFRIYFDGSNFKLPKRVFIHFVLFHASFHNQVFHKNAIFRFVLIQRCVWYKLQPHLEHRVPMAAQVVKCICTHSSFSWNRVWLDQQGLRVREACQEMWYVCTSGFVFLSVSWFL